MTRHGDRLFGFRPVRKENQRGTVWSPARLRIRPRSRLPHLGNDDPMQSLPRNLPPLGVGASPWRRSGTESPHNLTGCRRWISERHRPGVEVTRWDDSFVHRCFRPRCAHLYRPQFCIATSPFAIPTKKIGKIGATTVEGFHPRPGN